MISNHLISNKTNIRNKKIYIFSTPFPSNFKFTWLVASCTLDFVLLTIAFVAKNSIVVNAIAKSLYFNKDCPLLAAILSKCSYQIILMLREKKIAHLSKELLCGSYFVAILFINKMKNKKN